MTRRLALLAMLAGCHAAGAPAPAGRVGASLALTAAGLVVVDPDQGTVSVLDPDTLALRRTVDVGGEPRAMVPLASGLVVVANYRGGELVLVDAASGTVRARRAVCAGPYGLAEAPDGSFVAVACEWEGAVLAADPTTLTTRALLTGLRRPRAVAVVGASIYAAEFTGGEVTRTTEDGGAASVVSLVPASSPERPALTGMTAALATALLPDGDTLWAAHLLENDSGAALEPAADDYGTVTDGNPKLNPAVTALDVSGGGLAQSSGPVTYAVFDGGARVFNGPSALASDGAGHLLVAHLGTANVAVLDAAATTTSARVVGSFAVGAGPSGIAVDVARRLAYVDNAFDGSVSRLDLSTLAPGRPAQLTRVRAQAPRFSAAALEGRRIFNDAANRHLTPAGVVACATCHPDGGDDGHVWFIHTAKIPLKRRRTPHLANAKAGGPLHWDGAFATLEDLTRRTITDLMAGDGLLVDVAAVRAFVDELVQAPVGPRRDAAAVERGRAIFASPGAACATCHAPPSFADGKLHAVLSPESLTTDDAFAAARTPGLAGVFLRAPYFHDGRSPGLEDLLVRPDAAAHGSVAALTPADRADLVAYLESL